MFIAGILKLEAQNDFPYNIQLEPVVVSGLPGLHSFAFAQTNGKILIIGGRKDGLHPRQPFNAFPASSSNTDAYVVDINSGQSWTTSLSVLPSSIYEQLQSTNMNFFQDGDSLFLIGGYAYSSSAGDHITFPNLTAINVSGLINAIVSAQPITPYFKQITDINFANCGGQLAKIGSEFYLVGGQKFDGRYNPMGHPTYTQSYSNQIRKFEIDNSGNQLSISNYSTITNPAHLHRRDYNLLPQIMTDGKEGLLISSGVFQTNVDLPYLYPVEITDAGINPITGFSQYLSNYHSATAALFDSTQNTMHNIFFGGMSQYYYQNGNLIQDNQVPFVNTISRLSRDANGQYTEFKMQTEMPGLKGSSAEFIPNENISLYKNDVVKMNAFQNDTIVLGHIIGGINSSSLNPFSVNQTSLTNADNTVYKVLLIADVNTANDEIRENNPYEMTIYPNPGNGVFNVEISGDNVNYINYSLTNLKGQVIMEEEIEGKDKNINSFKIKLDKEGGDSLLNLILSVNYKYFFSEKLIISDN